MGELTFVSRAMDGLILVETWDQLSGNKTMQKCKKEAKELLKRIEKGPMRCSVDSQQHTFHYILEDGVCYMTLCDRSYPKKLAFSFLHDIHLAFSEELKREFGTHGADYRSLIDTIEKPYYFIKFDRVIQRKKQEYRDPRSNKSLNKLNDSLMEVQSIMRKNIDEILQRGEHLEDVGKKANDLKFASSQFAGMARKLSYKALLQQYGPVAIIVGVLLVIILWRFLLF